MITKRQLGLAAPIALKSGRLEEWYQPLVDAMVFCQINTPVREQFFLANILEETGELQEMEENLHYSAARIRQVFTGLLDGGAGAEAAAAGGPRGVANYVYSDDMRPEGYKMGNNYPDSGWINRGRGPEQITGEGNYRAYFKRVGMPIDSDRDLLLKPKHGSLSAATFWQDHHCNEIADRGDFKTAVQIINGGLTNYDTRLAYLNRLKDAMNHPDPVEIPAPPPPEPVPPVTPEDMKLPPIKDTVSVETLPPVPPKGFEVQPSGNVVLSDIKDSTIVKKANVGQVVAGTAGTVVAGATGVQAVKSIFDGINMSDIGIVVVGAVVIVAMVLAFFYFRDIKKDRVEMNRKGIA